MLLSCCVNFFTEQSLVNVFCNAFHQIGDCVLSLDIVGFTSLQSPETFGIKSGTFCLALCSDFQSFFSFFVYFCIFPKKCTKFIFEGFTKIYGIFIIVVSFLGNTVEKELDIY